MIKLLSTGCRRVSSRGLRDQSGGWRGKGRVDEVWNLGTTFSQLAIKRMLVSGIFKQLRTFVVVPDEQIFEDIEPFLLQRKGAMSASVEILFFWAWLIILVWENEPKLKETTVNYFESGHHQSFEEYTRDNSELVNQDARIVWASLTSSLDVSRYDCLFHDCLLAGNTARLLEILSVTWFSNLWCNYLQCRFL